MVRLALSAAVLASIVACNGKKPKTPARPTTGDAAVVAQVEGDPAACEPLSERIAELYRTELSDPIEGEVEDATEMILRDCRRQPARLAPCIQAAASVAALERDCTIPLDDAGSVEAAQLGASAP